MRVDVLAVGTELLLGQIIDSNSAWMGEQLAVGFALWPWFAVDAKWVWVSLLWAAVVLAVISGAQYLWYSRVTEKALAEQTVA